MGAVGAACYVTPGRRRHQTTQTSCCPHKSCRAWACQADTVFCSSRRVCWYIARLRSSRDLADTVTAGSAMGGPSTDVATPSWCLFSPSSQLFVGVSSSEWCCPWLCFSRNLLVDTLCGLSFYFVCPLEDYVPVPWPQSSPHRCVAVHIVLMAGCLHAVDVPLFLFVCARLVGFLRILSF